MNTRVNLLWPLLAAVSVISCDNRTLAPLVPCTVNSTTADVPIQPVDKVDLLFVIDDSGSMEEEQVKLQNELPQMVDALLQGEINVGGMPVEEFPPVTSLRVGVVNTDMGVSTTNVPVTFAQSCVTNIANASGRCDAVGTMGQNPPAPLRTDRANPAFNPLMMEDPVTNPSRLACDMSLTPGETSYQVEGSGDPNLGDFNADIACVTNQGITGCGQEQQLSSIKNAFRTGSNAGFLRGDALLAIILVTDEDDCSTDDVAVFDPRDNSSSGEQCQNAGTAPLCGPYTTEMMSLPPNCGDNPERVKIEQRCWAHRDRLTPVMDFIEALQAPTDPSSPVERDPSNVIFAAITGVPDDGVDLTDLQAVLGDPRMVQEPAASCDDSRVDCSVVLTTEGQSLGDLINSESNEQNEQLHPVCANQDGRAYPARRIVETAQGLEAAGVGTVVQSICQDDFVTALRAITNTIAEALQRFCLPSPQMRNAAGLVPCDVVEVLPAGEDTCDESRGRTPAGIDAETGRTRCRVEQLSSAGLSGNQEPAGLGWYYDDFSDATDQNCAFRGENRQRVRFTSAAAPEPGARVRLECLAPVPPETADIGFGCSTDADCARDAESLEEQYDRPNLELRCEPESLTCQLTCTNDAGCPGGYGCFEPDPLPTGGFDYCVNATCTLQ